MSNQENKPIRYSQAASQARSLKKPTKTKVAECAIIVLVFIGLYFISLGIDAAITALCSEGGVTVASCIRAVVPTILAFFNLDHILGDIK